MLKRRTETTDNMWLGDNELVIVFTDGRYAVIESYEENEIVFAGHYNECLDYLNDRYNEYLVSLV